MGLSERGAERLKTLFRNYLRTFFEFKNFNRNVAVVTDVFQRGGDRFEVNFAETGAFEVLIIGVEVGEIGPGLSDYLGDGLGFRAHRFDVENDFEFWGSSVG